MLSRKVFFISTSSQERSNNMSEITLTWSHRSPRVSKKRTERTPSLQKRSRRTKIRQTSLRIREEICVHSQNVCVKKRQTWRKRKSMFAEKTRPFVHLPSLHN